jgi:hypothetical protein
VYHATLFTEQCIMVELRAAQESSIFLLFICLRFARNLLWDPCKVNNFFFLTKHLLSAFLKKRNLYLVAKPRAPNIETQSSSIYFIFLQILSLVKKKHSIGIQWQKYSQLSTNNGRTGIHYRL